MIFNSQTPKEIKVDGTKILVKVPTASQQAKVLDMMAKDDPTHDDVVNIAKAVMDCTLVDFVDLVDELKAPIKVKRDNGILDASIVDGFTIAQLREYIKEIMNLCRVDSEVKKN